MKSLILIDKNHTIKNMKIDKNFYILNWNRSNGNDYNSIFEYIEKNDSFFQRKYLNLISKIKKASFFNKSLYKHFLINYNFKMWEMSLLEEKSFYKNPEINELLKILALKKFVKIKRINTIILKSDQINLKYNIQSLIKTVKIIYENKHCENSQINLRDNSFYFLFYLIKFFIRRYRFKKNSFKLNNNSLLICDYFTYFEKSSALKGKYISSFWRDLFPLLKKKNVNFLHLSLDEKNFNFDEKSTILKNLNTKKNSHNILDFEIDFNIFSNVLIKWFVNLFKYKIISFKYKNNFMFQNKVLDKMLRDSLIGVWSIKNLYFFFLFEKFFKKNQKKNYAAFYVSEFHGWEKSMLYNLKRHSFCKTYGVHFNPIRNWDLRYKFDITKDNANFFPDNIISFYISSKKHLRELFTNFNKKNLIIAQNLRALKMNMKMVKRQGKKKILIIGDHDDYSTINLLDMINDFRKLNKEYTFEYKPHPISKIDLAKFKNLSKTKIYKNNDCFKNSFSAYVVTNKTTLGLELINKKMKTAIFLDDNSINLSPVDKNYKFFIKNTIELERFLNSKVKYNNINKSRKISWHDIIKTI